jgi:cellulose synthase/poly-beta-1,6-N-acetylglucosamine synthase-like glycosyltransferase
MAGRLRPIVPARPGHRREASPIERRATRPKIPRCPEIDCIRHLLPRSTVAIAELRAAEIGVGADRVLIASGAIDAESYEMALADSLRIPFEPLVERPRNECPLSDAQLIEAANTGLLPLSVRDDVNIMVAPCLVDSRRLVAVARSGADIARRIRITSTAQLLSFVARHGHPEIEHRAAEWLRTEQPEFSAGLRTSNRWNVAILAAIAAATAAGAAPATSLMAVEYMLGAIFLAWTALRLLGLLSERLALHRPRVIADALLPVYSIAVPLYREATAVKGLVAALHRLNYPKEKLDIKLVLEADDIETRDALAELRLDPPFEIMIAPDSGPRTKPKALNAALSLARGSFLVVYDAEDRPEPDQLRLALEAFVAGDERLACVQARLTIDNAADSWLTRLFAAEYAGLFDVFLPGLAAWRLPLPLGGSSNHFRTSVLRRVGAWDPYNVTEDADLGMRLARFGYRTAMIPSTTHEEAPARFAPWLRQRTRWFKGWMQTWLVHSRSPLRLADDLGPTGLVVFQLLVGGTVLAALIHSLFAVVLLWQIAAASMSAEVTLPPMPGFHAAILFGGYLTSAMLGLIGLARRRALNCAWALLLMPAYWLLLSLAAWRALYQLVRDPYRWEKTEHGLARTSRLAQQTGRTASQEISDVTFSLDDLGDGLSSPAQQKPELRGPQSPRPESRTAQRYFFRSAAASSGRRLRLNGATKRPVLSIK